jgi:hypothetical protein
MDKGFIGINATKITAFATEAQQRGSYDDRRLADLISEIRGHVYVLQIGDASKEDLLARIAGRLRVKAAAYEAPEPNLPAKLTDPSLRVRIEVLRRSADLLSAKKTG